MQEQRDDLIKRLEEDGWRVVEIKTNVQEEWASEIWRVESEWSPKGFGFWLTLFANSNPSTEEEIYSCIGTSFVYPDDKEKAQGKPFLTFGKGWGTRATQFINDIARLRHDAFAKEMKQ